MKYDIFISYRWDGGEYTARLLRDRLEEAGYRVFFDVESLRSGDFNTKLYSVIDECTDFILVLSQNSLDRCVNDDDWVRREVEYALEKNKNVVPVMLRGFTFPDTLPESLEPLRYRNGLEANSQFFDAFLEKLQNKFLLTKKKVFSGLFCVRKLKPIVSIAAAAALLLCIGFGIYALLPKERLYPHTAAEKGLTDEVIYYIMENLTAIDLMSGAAEDALTAAHRYASSGDKDYRTLQNRLSVSRQTLENVDIDALEMSDGLLQRISGSPFKSSDLLGIHTVVTNLQKEWLHNFDYIEKISAPDYYIDEADRLEIIECHSTYLEEYAKANAYSANALLLPVTDKEALDEFFNEFLPILTTIPLNSASWQTDEAALRSAVDGCTKKMEKAVSDMAMLVGNTASENREMEAENKEMQELLDKLQQLMPKEGDGAEVLWLKFNCQMSNGMYDNAVLCLDAYEKATDDEDAAVYLPVVRKYVELCREHGLVYGIMMSSYTDPADPYELLLPGDIMLKCDGEICYDVDTFFDLFLASSDVNYTADILRAGETGEFEIITLNLRKDAPQTNWIDLVFAETE